MKNARDLAQGTLLMIAVVLIWGAFLPVSQVALRAIDPYWLSGLRFGAGALVFLGILAWREGRAALNPGSHWRRALLIGSVGIGGFGLLVFEGLKLTRPEQAAMILALTPVQVALWQWWKTGHRPDRVTLAAIAAALCGEALVITQGDLARLTGGDALGNGMLVLASLLWLVYTLGGQQFPGWSAIRFTAMTCGLGWFFIIGVALVATGAGHSRPPDPAGLQEVWWALAFVVFAVTVLALLFWNMAVVRLGPVNAGLFANFTPVVTYGIAVAQGRHPAPVELAGVLLVIGALVTNNLHQRRKLALLGQR